ncbi:hypothetical protein ACF1HJ_40475 [Streptomyces sp. NPDC013978]|uniref:hypothetical protein n=1 Tax=Streptomyces sp. NPDC013978 TaxID=3364869 RepID=UPI0036FBE234
MQKLFNGLPAEDGVCMYGFRHYFASNAFGNGIPITDVAEWMASGAELRWSAPGPDLGEWFVVVPRGPPPRAEVVT